MESSGCPVCTQNHRRSVHATDIFFGSEENFTYLQCSACGHLELEMADHVGGGEFGRGTFEDKDEKVVVDVMDHPALGRVFYQPRSRWITHRTQLGPQHQVLDVGCGSGHFLSALKARSGAQCSGIDLDPAYEQKAQKDGIRRVTGDFEAWNTDERFDLITMFHLIEHLNNPVAAIQKAYQLLKPGGYLYIETPAADSLAFKTFRKYWLPLLPPYHRHVFSRRSMERMLGEHFDTMHSYRSQGVYVPGEVIFSTWLLWGKICPHPFRRRQVPGPIKAMAVAGMTVSSLAALPVEMVVAATVKLADLVTQHQLLLAAHQRVLCQRA